MEQLKKFLKLLHENGYDATECNSQKPFFIYLLRKNGFWIHIVFYVYERGNGYDFFIQSHNLDMNEDIKTLNQILNNTNNG